MAFITTAIKLNEVARTVNTRLYFPTDLPDTVGNEVKGVITLLHGLSNTSEDWMKMSAACRYAADNGYVLVAPDADNSLYTDMASGTFVHIFAELLPAQLQKIFNIPHAREVNYIAGLSLGGYGAMLLGMLRPHLYAAIGSFSGALDMRSLLKTPQMSGLFRGAAGEAPALPEEYDLFHLARQVSALPKQQQTRLFCTCGRQDDDWSHIHTQNQAFRQLAETLPLDYTYLEWDGVHEWNFWDRSLAEFIGFIQGGDYGVRKRADWSAPVQTGKPK